MFRKVIGELPTENTILRRVRSAKLALMNIKKQLITARTNINEEMTSTKQRIKP